MKLVQAKCAHDCFQPAMTHHAPVLVVPYSPLWLQAFEAERALLQVSIPERNICVEHIGSTSVPGLSAKPIIDLMLGTTSLQQVDSWIPILEGIGYEYMSPSPIPFGLKLIMPGDISTTWL